jgi:Protein of unknown function (DUF4232)
MRPVQQMRTVLGLTTVALIMVLALASTGAQATGSARIASACPNETVTVLELKPVAVTLRFVLHGVSCTKAHSLIRTYFRHEATPGYCRNRGNICAFVSGGYVCSLPLYAGEGGGDFAGCARENPPANVVKVFKVSRAAPPASAKLPHPCASRQLVISLGKLSAGLGHLAVPIRFHDRGGTCSLRGFPRVDGLSASGRVIIRAKRALKGYFGRWRIATITLKNGQTASALLEGLDPAFFSRHPRSSRSLRITPPNASHSVWRRTSYPLCYLAIHPVVAGRNGGGA